MKKLNSNFCYQKTLAWTTLEQEAYTKSRAKKMSQEKIPDFLTDLEYLKIHFEEQFQNLNSTEKGEKFLTFALEFLLITEEFETFTKIEKSKKLSHDDGIDFVCSNPEINNKITYGQSKYNIKEKSELDTIMSKFYNWENQTQTGKSDLNQEDLFGSFFEAKQKDGESPIYVIITLSKLDKIIEKYEKSILSSLSFYKKLKSEKRLIIFDGNKILNLIKSYYVKINLLPYEIKLKTIDSLTRAQNVWLGVVNGEEIVKIYQEHGEALFFENIRDFIGIKNGVNKEIEKTITTEPEKMLERNNGLTFRAKEVSIQDNHVILKRGALINGCQTTMCLNKNSEFANLCNIQIKIIEKSDEDSWDVAKSSNFQNEITRMDLELAKYIRPQIFRKTAADFGYNVETVSENPKDILHSIYKEKINYDTVKLLYVGFFSDDASQVFEKKYNKIRFDILNKLENTSEREDIFKAIFLLSIEIHRCSEQTRDKIRKNQEQFRVDIFDRLFDESKYIAFMGILLSSVLVRKNFYAINNIQETVDFFNKLQDVFINNKVKIITDYKECYKMIASLITHKSEGESDLLRYMHRRIKETKFSEHYRMVMTQKALNDTLE